MIEKLLIILPLLPLLGFAINLSFGKLLPKIILTISANLSIALSLLISIYLFLNLGHKGNFLHVVELFNWLDMDGLNISLSFYVDTLSAIMLLIVTSVALLVHIYSIAYMEGDKSYHRYFAYLNLFVAFMIILVTGSNLLVTFIGWEGVGLASYLLIGFWFDKREYCRAASKAFIMNRIGDAALLLAMFILIGLFRTLDFAELNILASATPFLEIKPWVITLVAVLILFASTGKSAQLPLFTWLPDAMAGPTPVSALMHAATMVTAGVYLVIRLNFIFIQSPIALSLMAGIGLATAILAATIACFQLDIKKILAFSTVSQLGYMFLALGLGAFSAAFFHLITHAFFKALLFLSAGSVIHAIHTQDLFSLGGLKKYMPITFICMLIGGLAISGIPPFAGFFSKDAILEEALHVSLLAWTLVLVVAMMTAYYTFRLIFNVFLGSFKSQQTVRESSLFMTAPMIVLSIFSVLAGFINVPAFLGGSSWLSNFARLDFPLSSPVLEDSHASSLNPIILNLFAVIASALSIFIAYKKATKGPDSALKRLRLLAFQGFYIDKLYVNTFVKPLNSLSVKMPGFVDRRLVDGLINSITSAVKFLANKLKFIQSGNISHYLLIMVCFIALIIFFLNYFITLL